MIRFRKKLAKRINKILLPDEQQHVTSSKSWIEEMDLYLIECSSSRPFRDNTTPRLGLVDSGADINLVREAIVEELGLNVYREVCRTETLGSGTVILLGFVLLPWRIAKNPKRDYYTKFYVVPKEHRERFDFLLGCEWLAVSKVYGRDPRIKLARLRKVLDHTG